MAVFFPIFYKQYWGMGIDTNLSTFRLGMGNALASLLVALMAPILGAIADRSGRRKHFLICFTYLGALVTAALALIGQGQWFLSITLYAIGVVGFSGGTVLYDALLPQVAPAERIDQVSSLGYALGYLGGGLLLSINVAMTLNPTLFGLQSGTQAVKASFVSVALWWGLFAAATFAWVPPDPQIVRPPIGQQIAGGWRQLVGTFKRVRQLKTLYTFLFAYWCYIDGVDTIVRMAVDYGMSIGFGRNDLILALLITQFIGFPSALAFGVLGKHWGVRRSIFLALAVYIATTLWGAFMDNVVEFYILAAVIGLVQGGIQALSRSYYTRLIPHQQSAEFFGFYNMLGKFAAIVGPALMGITGLIVKRLALPADPGAEKLQAVTMLATRTSIASVLILFFLGAVLFYYVDEKKGETELKNYLKSKKSPEAGRH